jgi:hypothetical protein
VGGCCVVVRWSVTFDDLVTLGGLHDEWNCG